MWYVKRVKPHPFNGQKYVFEEVTLDKARALLALDPGTASAEPWQLAGRCYAAGNHVLVIGPVATPDAASAGLLNSFNSSPLLGFSCFGDGVIIILHLNLLTC